MLSTYDSAFERESAEYLSTLSVVRCNDPFPFSFKDKEGTTFNALPDFYHAPTGLLLELKCADLNPKTSVRTAQNAMRSREAYRAYRGESLTNFDMIENSWSNSVKKQSIVQGKLNSAKFIIVFDKLPALKEAIRLVKAGITFCTLGSLKNYLDFLYLQKMGATFIQFIIEYPEDGISFVLTRST